MTTCNQHQYYNIKNLKNHCLVQFLSRQTNKQTDRQTTNKENEPTNQQENKKTSNQQENKKTNNHRINNQPTRK